MENAGSAQVPEAVSENAFGDHESEWVARRLDQIQDIEEIAVGEVVNLGSSLTVLHTKTDLMPLDTPQLLIDSGASASLAGRPWVSRRLKLAGIKSYPSMTRSSEVPRFGNPCAYPSEWAIRLNAGWVLSRSTTKKLRFI